MPSYLTTSTCYNIWNILDSQSVTVWAHFFCRASRPSRHVAVGHYCSVSPLHVDLIGGASMSCWVLNERQGFQMGAGVHSVEIMHWHFPWSFFVSTSEISLFVMLKKPYLSCPKKIPALFLWVCPATVGFWEIRNLELIICSTRRDRWIQIFLEFGVQSAQNPTVFILVVNLSLYRTISQYLSSSWKRPSFTCLAFLVFLTHCKVSSTFSRALWWPLAMPKTCSQRLGDDRGVWHLFVLRFVEGPAFFFTSHF